MTITKWRVSILLAVAALAIPAGARTVLGDVALHQALLDLGTDLRLMCVAAHPDDEDGATLAMYRKKWGYKTFAVIATRGEGGQNEIGPELYNELGVIRTHEMRRASEITGAELHFLDLPEFGFSKSAEETYAIWGREEPLRRMVRTIRELKPDVIISHHGPERGHGHHQVVGITLLEAFDAAADPDVFPEQIRDGLEPWQVARFYVRPFGGGGGGGHTVTNDTSELDQAHGYTYAEIAARALYEHQSQGMGFFVDRFLSTRSSTTYYLQREAPGGVMGGGGLPAPGGGLFEGLTDRVSSRAREISRANLGRKDAKEAALELLRTESGAVHEDANRIAAIAMQLRLRTQISDPEVVPGQTLNITGDLFDYGERDAESVTFSIEAEAWMPMDAPAPKQVSYERDNSGAAGFEITIPTSAVPTIPHPENLFEPHFLEPQFHVVAQVHAGDAIVEVREPIYVDVAPPVSLSFLDAPYLLRRGVDKQARFELMVTNHSPGPMTASIVLSPAAGFLVPEQELTVQFAAEGDQKVLPIVADVAANLEPRDYILTAAVANADEVAHGTARLVDVAVPENINVGVVQSYDDTFMMTLERFGVPHQALTVRDFSPKTLDTFSTIIIDIRAYLVRPELVANNRALLDYVERGGTVIVNYHKTFEWKEDYAPFPIALSRNRVTVEDAPINVLVPDHPLFNVPNRIVPSDWEGWIQERGLYFPNRWADAYTPLVDTQDPGENNPPGSVLIADYGEGTYMYTALGWYRQLRELHPGTLRIFANMLGL